MMTPAEVVRIAVDLIDPRSFTETNGHARRARNLLLNGKPDEAKAAALTAIASRYGCECEAYRMAADTTPTGA